MDSQRKTFPAGSFRGKIEITKNFRNFYQNSVFWPKSGEIKTFLDFFFDNVKKLRKIGLVTWFWAQYADFCKKRPSKHLNSVAKLVRVPGHVQKTSFLFSFGQMGPEDHVQGGKQRVHMPLSLFLYFRLFFISLFFFSDYFFSDK